MRKLLIKIGKDFGTNQWGIMFGNQKSTLSFHVQEGFPQTVPFPGAVLEEDGITQMIEFLQQTLRESNENEQSNLERPTHSDTIGTQEDL